jgi:hypothetical protein
MEPMSGPVLEEKTAMSVSADGRRWLSVGESAHPDSEHAGHMAAQRALGTATDARLILVFCPLSRDPQAVLAGVTAASGDVPLIGCSAREVIAPSGPSQESVVVVGLGGAGLEVSTGMATGVADQPREAGTAAASRIVANQTSLPHEVLLLITDGLAARQEEVLAGVYRVVGASVPLVGGSSTPDWSTKRNFQLYGDQVLTDAVVGAAIASDGPFGIGLGHGWRKVGEPMLVTRSEGRDVFTLNDQPALRAYLQRLGAPQETYTDPDAFKRFSRTRPIGIRRRSGEEVRTVNSTAGFDGGWLRAGAKVPEGGVVWVMEGEDESVVRAAGDACRDAAEALDGNPPLGFLAFDCASRASMLGAEGIRAEVEQMTEVARATASAGVVPVGGLYTAGEIARTSGINGFHNQTLVVLAVG